MKQANFIQDISQKLTDVLPSGLSEMRDDLKTHFKQVLQSSLANMNLVTREEFDVQVAVLERTRAKVEALEKRVAALEAHEQKHASNS